MSDRSEIILQHNGVFTRLQAKADGIIRVTRTRRENFLASISPVVVCDGTGSGFLQDMEHEAIFRAGSATVRPLKDT